MTLKPGEKLGNYQIVQLLGEGGFGAVYLALNTMITVPTATGEESLKVALKQLNSARTHAVDRFKREAGVLVELSHSIPSVTRVYQLEEIQGKYYLVMEYVEGGTLATAAKIRQLSEAELIAIAIEVCHGLSAMHRNNPSVIHRDIKPENIKVKFGGSKPAVKILDLGVAGIIFPNRAPEVEAVGTIVFARPSQVKGEVPSPGQDIYSLGATLYWTMQDPSLSDEARFLPYPFEGWRNRDEREAVLRQYPPSFVSQLPSNFPDYWDPHQEALNRLNKTPYSQGLKTLVAKMISLDVMNQYGSIDQVCLELENLAGFHSQAKHAVKPPGISPKDPSGGRRPPPPPPASSTSGAFLPVQTPKKED